MNERWRFFVIIIATNLILYFGIDKNIESNDQKIKLRQNLATLNLPIKSYFKWSDSELINGIDVSIEDDQGVIIIPHAVLFSTKKLDLKKPKLAVVQVPLESVNKIKLPSEKQNTLYALPFNSAQGSSEKKDKRPNEIFI